jgi:uncharacterized surface protein with fasciclin (FAS1) repeats
MTRVTRPMNSRPRQGRARFACAAAGLIFAVAACGPAAQPSAPAAPARPPVPAGIFDRRCPVLPARVLNRLAALPVMRAIARFGSLRQFRHAVGVAGLTGQLNSARAITVFVPDDVAFTTLGSGNVGALLADPAGLRQVVRELVVTGRRSAATLASRRWLRTLAGTQLRPELTGQGYQINNGKIVCTGVRTRNATVYVVDRFLIPYGGRGST